MGRTAPRRKAAPTVFKQIEGISSEEEGEASAPENEEELLASGDASEELLSSEESGSALSDDIVVESFEEVATKKPAKTKSRKEETYPSENSSENSGEDPREDVPAPKKAAKSAPKAKAPKAKARSKAKAPAKVAKAVGRDNVRDISDSSDESSEVVPVSRTVAKKKIQSSKNGDAGDGSSADVSEENASGKRHFKIQTDTIEPSIELDKLSSGGGRFGGSTPMQAAKKAFTQICRAVETSSNEDCEYIFTITETTRGSPGKDFTYIGTRKRRTEPQPVVKRGESGSTTFNINYEHQVKSYKPGKKTVTASKNSATSTKEKSSKASKAEALGTKASKAEALGTKAKKESISSPEVVDTHRRSKKARSQKPPKATDPQLAKKVSNAKRTIPKTVAKKSKITKK